MKKLFNLLTTNEVIQIARNDGYVQIPDIFHSRFTPDVFFSPDLNAWIDDLARDEPVLPSKLSGRERIIHRILECNNKTIDAHILDGKDITHPATVEPFKLEITNCSPRMIYRYYGNTEKGRTVMILSKEKINVTKIPPTK